MTRTTILAALALFVFSAAPAEATDQALQTSLTQFLQKWDTDPDEPRDETARYAAAFYDLNGSGSPQAIVYLLDKQFCGTGGCPTLILTQDKDSWRIVTEVSISRPPIRVLPTTSHGWHDIAVFVAGGGILPGYEAKLRFDGKTYPSNPSMPPSEKMKDQTAGETLIPSMESAIPLYE